MKQFLTLFIVLISFCAIAQEQCGFDQTYNEQDYVIKPFGFVIPQGSLDTASILTIPIVIHVIHLGEDIGIGTNISNEQVQSAIVALNEDFRKISGTNGDGLGVDTKIEFCMASRDPNGQPTNGITRTDGTVIPGYAENGIKTGIVGVGANEIAVKSLVAWPFEDYLNVFVVSETGGNNGGGGIQGYAYFPFNSVQFGVVILHNAIGTVGNLKSYTSLNRVFTHEVGHCLKLYHTFSASSDCVESNCDTQGDQVCDTPATTGSNSCNPPTACPDAQIENYMDYSSETCKNTLTEGQAWRMRNAIYNELGSLLTSIACDPVYDIDLAITDVRYLNPSCVSHIDIEVDVTNYGALGINLFTVSVNGTNFTYNIDLLPSGQTLTIIVNDVMIEGIESMEVNVETTISTDELIENNNMIIYPIYDYAGDEVTITIHPDAFSLNENTFWVVNSLGEFIINETSIVDDMVVRFCVYTGCYYFVINDQYGDGMAFGGWYTISKSDGSILYDYTGIFGDVSTEFTIQTHEICYPYPCNTSCPSDLNGDGHIGSADMVILLSQMWEIGTGYCADLNFDGIVNGLDLTIMTNELGSSCIPGVTGYVTNITEDFEIKLQSSYITDIVGRKIKWDGSSNIGDLNLRHGIYILIETWSNGTITSTKIFLN